MDVRGVGGSKHGTWVGHASETVSPPQHHHNASNSRQQQATARQHQDRQYQRHMAGQYQPPTSTSTTSNSISVSTTTATTTTAWRYLLPKGVPAGRPDG
jgi:hypothetical protein